MQIYLLVLLTLFGLCEAQFDSSNSGLACWKETTTRGAGTVPTECGANEEDDAGLCYPVCSEGYSGVGPVCYSDCPVGWTDGGLFCYYDQSFTKITYDRGVGIIPNSVCPSDHPDSEAGLCYMNCNSGYSGSATICSQNCLPGWTDGGVLHI